MKHIKSLSHKLIFQLLPVLFISVNLYGQNTDSLLKKLQTVTGKDKVLILNELSVASQSNDPEKQLKYGSEAVKLARQINDTENECIALRNVGIAYCFMSQYNRALKYFEESLSLALNKGLKKEVALSYNSLGNYNYLTGNLEKALDYYKKALKIGEEIGNKQGMISYINNIGIIYSNMGKNDSALEYYFRSLKISESMKSKPGISKAYANIGAVYNDIKNYPKALEYFNKSLTLANEINDQYLKAGMLNNSGNIYAAMGNSAKALECYTTSLSIKEKIGDEFGKAISLADIGSIYSKMGNNKQALEYQKQALSIQQKTGNTEGEIIAYISLSKTYINIKKYKDAAENLEKAAVKAANFNTKMLLDIYEEESGLYEKMGKYNEAYNTYRRYKELNDSLFNENSSLQIAELQTKYETEKKDKEISLLLRDKKISDLNRNEEILIRNILLGGIIALLLTGLVIIKKNMAIKKANRLLEDKVKETNEQKEELKKLSANKDKLMSIVSHDLRSPFQALVGYSELLAVNIDDLSKDEIIDYSKDINLTAHQTLEMLENLLEWSRLQLDKIQLNPERINAENFITKTMRLMLHSASAKEIMIKAEIPQNFHIFADEPMITSALHNLLTNSIKFSFKGGIVTVKAVINNNFAEISVIDNGVGITKQNISKLFNRNIHFSTKGTADEKGTGLGLELTKELVERNGGTISVISEEGAGASFTFTVPLAK
jgi:signal transduction histidine kinase/Tfp pilus assembly protein PilF